MSQKSNPSPSEKEECPNTSCKSDDLLGGEKNFDEDWASQDWECVECGTTWREVYNFSHASDIQIPKTS